MNYISFLLNTDNTIVHDHDQNAAILWNSLKDRIGKTKPTTANFHIEHLANMDTLYDLEQAFTREEIDKIIQEMPNDKSPRPDGFNGIFLKKCWHIIKDTFYNFLQDFYEEKIDLTPVNSAFIALIPKKENPESPNDYRPISLVSMPIKILTNMLASRT